MDDDEGATKVLSSSLAGIVRAFAVCAFQLNTAARDDAMSSFEVHRSNEAMRTVTVEAILFLT